MIQDSIAKSEFEAIDKNIPEKDFSNVDILCNKKELFSKGEFLKSKIQSTLKLFEKIGCDFPIFGNNYEKFFYRSLVEKELEMADLSDDSKILVVGSGPFPMTGIYLAENGYDVLCIDKDEEAIKSSEKKVRRSNTDLTIRFKKIDGKFTDYSDFDAVWVPLHVTPRKDVVLKILNDLDHRAKVIFRNPRGIWDKVYPKIDPYVFDIPLVVKKQPLGKESVLLIKDRGGFDSMKRLTENRNEDGSICDKNLTKDENSYLCELKCGESAIILDCPEDPQLNALGLRPGKYIKSESKQPFGGPFLTSIEGRKIALDPDIAKRVACRKA